MVISIHRTLKRNEYKFIEIRGLTQKLDAIERLIKYIKRVLSCNGIIQDYTNEPVIVLYNQNIDQVKDLLVEQLGVAFIRNDTTDPYHYVQVV